MTKLHAYMVIVNITLDKCYNGDWLLYCVRVNKELLNYF